MLNIKGTKLLIKFLSVVLAVMIMVCGITTTAYASCTTVDGNKQVNNETIISYNEQWITPLDHVETTTYDLGNGFTATVTTTSKYGITRASGTKTDTQQIEIKDGKN